MADLWRKRRWQFLLDLTDQLPRQSRLSEAQSDDDDLAQHVLKLQQERGEKPYAVRLSEFDPTREELMVIADRLGTLINIKFGKQQVKPRTRPVTAIERVQLRKRREKHEQLVAKVLPHKRKPE